MKLHMKLRTRLFLGFSALMTVALLGLMLALVSVMQMAKSQERLIGDNFTAIELNPQMRHALGNMLLARMHAETDVALKGSKVPGARVLEGAVLELCVDTRGGAGHA